MKFFSILISILLFSLTSFSQTEYLSKSGKATHLWGVHGVQALNSEPYSEWYEKSISKFEPNLSDLGDIDLLEKAEVKIYIGTWCGDTKKWVPKFIELWKELDLSTDQIQLIALHNSQELYKQGPNREELGQNIHRVPTFSFTVNGEEIGRIVERPLHSLERDLAQIVKGVPSAPRYQGVTYLNQYFNNSSSEMSKDEFDIVYKDIRRNLSGPGELNTYGYVLKAAVELDKALFVFELNSKIYPFDPNCHDSLGEMNMKLEKWEEAKTCFEKVLSLLPNDERSISKLYEINNAIANL